MSKTDKQPSEVLQEFLTYVEQVRQEYKDAYEAVGTEDKRLQDLLHELEFAEDKLERNKIATRFQRSRRERRKNKDKVQRLEILVDFFDSANHKNTMNKMRQMINRQEQREEYLNNERQYKPRVEE